MRGSLAVACRRRRRHHPALRAPLLEGGECLGVVNVCGKTVRPSPATLASLVAVAAPPASRPDQRSEPPRTAEGQRPVTPASSLDSGAGTSWRAGEQRPITPASSLDSGTGTSWRAGEERPITLADSAGPATFPSSQEGWPKAGVVGPRRPSGLRRHRPHLLIACKYPTPNRVCQEFSGIFFLVGSQEDAESALTNRGRIVNLCNGILQGNGGGTVFFVSLLRFFLWPLAREKGRTKR